MSENKCFVCTREIQNAMSDNAKSSWEENSILFCQILELPDLGRNETEEFDERCMSFCRLCLNRILNIRDMLEELETLEKRVLDEKYSIELLLKDKDKSQGQFSSDQLRGKIVTELRATSIKSMLAKIRKKRVGQRRNTKASCSLFRIMKNVAIPNIACETLQPIFNDQGQTGNVKVTSQESQSQVVHQHSFLPKPQRSFMSNESNDDLESQGTHTMKEEIFTASVNATSDNEECDIKYEIRSDADMTVDPLQLELEHFNLQHKGFFSLISAKPEVGDPADEDEVTRFSDRQQTTTTIEDLPPSRKNCICRTCGADFESLNKLRTHVQMHWRSAGGKITVKTIRPKRKKSRHNTTKPPHLRPKKCEECGKVLASSKTWTQHVMSFHRGEYKYKCTVCNSGFQNAQNLRRHIKNKHSVNAEDLKCSKCDRVFESKRICSRHILDCRPTQK